MGACVSTPRGCVGGRSSSSKKKKKKSFKRVASRLPTDGSLDKVDRPPPVDRHSSFTNPALQGHLFYLFPSMFIGFQMKVLLPLTTPPPQSHLLGLKCDYAVVLFD